MESVSKSIIYGTTYTNNYGRFLPFCSSIVQKTNVDAILEYISDVEHFKKYNSKTYAYRVEETPIVFITQKKNTELNFYQGSHNDQTLEGSGDKLLHMLQKFGIQNVVVGCLIEQFNPLLPFESLYYRAIVENSRLLLDELYQKVVHLKKKQSIEIQQQTISTQNIKQQFVKKKNIGEGIELPRLKTKLSKKQPRPNYVYKSVGKPKFAQEKRSVDSSITQVKFLWERCKNMQNQYFQIIDTITEKEIEQMQYYLVFEKSDLRTHVIKMLMICEGIEENEFKNYDFHQMLRMPFEVFPKNIVRKLEDIKNTVKQLNVDNLLKISRHLTIIFSLIELRLKFSKIIPKVTKILAQAQKTNPSSKFESVNSTIRVS